MVAVLLIFGILQLRNMSINVYPEFDPPLVEVQTEALGLSAAEMEALITVPLEADLLNGVAWLDEIYSESVAGMSSILLVFEPGTDPIRARQMVQERLTQTFALPNVSKPPTMLQPLSSTNRAMIVGISSEEVSLVELGVLARWNIKPRLMGVDGVANVTIWGHRDRQLQVQVDPKILASNNVSLLQVIATAGEALWVSPLTYLESSAPGTAGWVDTPNQRLTIRHELPISSAEDLAQVAVVDSDNLILGDIAQVVEDHQPLIGDAVLSNGPGLMLVIEKFPGANILEVTRGVEDALAAMAPGLSGLDIDNAVYRPASYIESASSNLTLVVIIVALLIIVVLVIFFYEWRTILISFITIPITLVTTVAFLHLRGESFNFMVLAGLVVAMGIVVDNAIVDVANIRHRLKQRGGESATTIVHAAIMEVRSPLSFALLIILITAIPIFFVPGLAGIFFAPFALSYVIALLVSLLVSIVITPALSLVLLENRGWTTSGSPAANRLEAAYGRFLQRTVHSPKRSLSLAVVIVLFGLIALPFLDISLLPTLKRTHLLIEWEGVPGTSRAEMNRIASTASQELQSIEGVQNVGFQVGRAITGDSVVGINSGEFWVSLDPEQDYEVMLTKVTDTVASYPGLFRNVQNYRPERTEEALLGSSEDLVVRIYGTEMDVIYEQADRISQQLAGIEGITSADFQKVAEEPQIEIEVDLAASERFRIKPGDVRRQATTLLSGLQVGNLYEENKIFDVIVWGIPELRQNLSAIERLPIDTPEGLVPLTDLAEVRIVPSPIVIRREVVSRFADINVAVSGRNLVAVANDITAILRSSPFPLEYHGEVRGSSAEQQSFGRQVIFVIVAILVGILLLYQATFGNWQLAAVSLMTLPITLSGGVLSTLISGGTLSIGSLFGFLTILAVAVRSGILQINQYQQIERREGITFGPRLVLRGSGQWVGRTIATALILITSFAAIILIGNKPGLEIVQPMAIVIVGGLITTTTLNLFILPHLFLRFGSNRSSEFAGSDIPGNLGLEGGD